MLIMTTMLTMIAYWIGFGATVAAFLFLMYNIAQAAAAVTDFFSGGKHD